MLFLFCNVGSIPLDPSLTQSFEDGQALIDLFPESSTLNAVKMITSKLVQMESNGDQWSKEQLLFSKYIMVAEHVAFIQLDKYDWDGQVMNHWILLTTIINWKILSWYANKSSKLWWEEKWREVKENWKWWRYEVCWSLYTHLLKNP